MKHILIFDTVAKYQDALANDELSLPAIAYCRDIKKIIYQKIFPDNIYTVTEGIYETSDGYCYVTT